MLGEFAVDARVSPIYKRYTDVETTILAGAGEIELHFKSRAATLEDAQAASTKSPVWSKTNWTTPSIRATANGWSRSSATGYRCAPQLWRSRILTGGLLAERITSVSGSSRYFLGGAVVYSNNLKTELAGVPAEMIRAPRRSQPRMAAAFAEGIRYRCESTLGVGITGVAGPGGGTAGKTCWPGISRCRRRHRNRNGRAELSPATANASAASPPPWRWIW